MTDLDPGDPCPMCGSTEWAHLPSHLRNHCEAVKAARERVEETGTGVVARAPKS